MRKMSNYMVVAIAAGLISCAPYPASAEPTPAPTPPPITTIDSFKAAQEQFRKDRELYLLALRDRDLKMRLINATFKSDVDKATSDAKSAMASATTPDQKNAINSTRRNAVAAAIIARENAIAALGPLPMPPQEPVKPLKAEKFGSIDQKGKQKR